MSGEDRAEYLYAAIDESDLYATDQDWTVIVDQETGVAYTFSNHSDEGWHIPRFEVAGLIDAGELPR